LELWILKLNQLKPSAVLQLFDRYFHDVVVDPDRYNYYGPAWLACALVHLVPQPDIWFVLDAPPEVLRARKPDLTLVEARRQQHLYLDLFATRKNAILVDASQPAGDVLAQVAEAITAYMERKAGPNIPTLPKSSVRSPGMASSICEGQR
jgi:thymidylate kinase